MKGRPLRFLALVLGTWIAGRVTVLSMHAAPPPAPPGRAFAGDPMPSALAWGGGSTARGPLPPTARRPVPSPHGTVARLPTRWRTMAVARAAAAMTASSTGVAFTGALTGSVKEAVVPGVQLGEPAGPPPLLTAALPPAAPPARPSRWAGSVWGIVRGAGDDRRLPGVQLGGSQAGLRLTHALGEGRRVALAGRVSTPLGGQGREAALGVEWRPFALPVRLLAEQRWSLDGGRGGPTVLLAGGLPPTRVGPLVAEAYAQGGAIARGRIYGFADGAVRLSMPAPWRALPLDLGVGAWGGVQPGAARLDLGPSLGVRVPVGGRQVRVTLDWRQRVAGRARPGSGPALSIGSDF